MKLTNFFRGHFLALFVGALLGLAVILATYFRFRELPQPYVWWGDIGRDMLVSRHIWMYHEQVQLGHHASGLHSNICQVKSYPNFYYYYLAFLWTLTGSYGGVFTVLVFLGCMSVITNYQIGKELGGVKVGLIAAALYTFSWDFIFQGRVAIGLQVSIPLCLFATLMVLKSFSQKNRTLNVLGCLLLIFASTFHYSALILVGFFFLISEMKFRKKCLTDAIKSSFLIVIMYGSFFLALHHEIIRACGGILQFLSLFIGGGSSAKENLLLEISTVIQSHFSTLFPYLTKTAAMCISFIVGIAFLFSHKSRLTTVAIVLLMSIFLLAGSLFTSQDIEMKAIQTMYVRYVFVLFVSFSLGCAIEESLKRSWHLLTAVFLIIGIFLVVSISDNFIFLKQERSFMSERELASSLLSQTEYQPFQAELFRSGQGNYDTAILAFWLEELTNQKRYAIQNDPPSYIEINPKTTYTMFICDTQYQGTEDAFNCDVVFQNLQDQNNSYRLVNSFTAIDRYLVQVFKRY